MSSSVFREGATALITGAGSGIGFAVAQLCRSHGMNLVLVDLHAANLTKVQHILDSTATAKTVTHVMDVFDMSSWEYLRDTVKKNFPNGIDLLMLNAGTSLQPKERSKQWEDPEYFHKTFMTNMSGVVFGIATFLPVLASTGTASHKAIVITGSKQGITNPPGAQNPAYNASKSAVKTVAEHLCHDLRSNKATQHISVHLLIPGWTYTSLTGSAGPLTDEEATKTKPAGAWLPSQVAEFMHKQMEQGKFYILCPDNDVTGPIDQARLAWAVGDIISGRPALSRWDEAWKDKASEWISKEAERLAGA